MNIEQAFPAYAGNFEWRV